jgi:quercetin dioxygenase-like cupin family protein
MSKGSDPPIARADEGCDASGPGAGVAGGMPQSDVATSDRRILLASERPMASFHVPAPMRPMVYRALRRGVWLIVLLIALATVQPARACVITALPITTCTDASEVAPVHSIGAGVDIDQTARTHGRDLAAVLPLLPPDHPRGNGVTVTLVALQAASNLHAPAFSTFLVDYAPGGSAVLHLIPTSGYVVVHVLSGKIGASAWQVRVGTYHTGETWVQPASANDIATTNPSADQGARVLVMLLTGDARRESQSPLGAD